MGFILFIIAMLVGVSQVVLVLTAAGIKTWLFEPFVIPSDSNSPTIMNGDRILVAKQQPARSGDFVVLSDPSGQVSAVLRRVIAAGGDTVDIRDDKVWLNGKPLDEPYTRGRPTQPGTIALPLKVPVGTVFVMGDNRPISGDSRFYGPVPTSTIIGRVVAIYSPVNRIRGF